MLVDVVKGGKGVGIELGSIKTAKGDFTVVLLIGETGDLVRGDGVSDKAGLCEGLDWGESLLLRKSLEIARCQ